MSSPYSIIDVLSKPTPMKAPNTSEFVKPTTANFSEKAVSAFQNLMPKNEPEEEEEEAISSLAPVRKIEREELEMEEVEHSQLSDEDAEDSAEAMIDMIDLLQKGVFTFFVTRKMKRKYSPKVLKKFEDVSEKELLGEELTEEETKILAKFEKFEKRMDLLLDDIPFTDQDKEDLKKATEKLMKKSGMKIPPSLWFGINLVSLLGDRFMKVAKV